MRQVFCVPYNLADQVTFPSVPLTKALLPYSDQRPGGRGGTVLQNKQNPHTSSFTHLFLPPVTNKYPVLNTADQKYCGFLHYLGIPQILRSPFCPLLAQKDDAFLDTKQS